LDLREMGFESVDPETTGRPAYHPSVLLKPHASHLPATARPSPATLTRRQIPLQSPVFTQPRPIRDRRICNRHES
jgi:hypothetical protein